MAKTGHGLKALTIFVLSCSMLCATSSAELLDDKSRLILDLTERYRARKFVNILNSSFVLKTDLKPLAIYKIDEVSGIMESRVLYKFTWEDSNVGWNASEYGGIESATVETEIFWLPDILIDNSVDVNSFLDRKQDQIIVSSSGSVLWSSPSMVRTLCNINVRYFPFDVQICNIEVSGLMGNYMRSLRFEVQGVDKEFLQQNSEWYLSSMTYVNRNVDYAYIKLSFTLHRRSTYYVIKIVVPAVLLSFLNSAVFLLPGESGERVAMSVSAILSLTVFLSYIGNITPPNSPEIPFIAWFILLHLGSAAVSTICNIVSLNLLLTAQGNDEKSDDGKDAETTCGCTPNCVPHPAPVEPTDGLAVTDVDEVKKDVKTRKARAGLLVRFREKRRILGCLGVTVLDKLLFYVLLFMSTAVTVICLACALMGPDME